MKKKAILLASIGALVCTVAVTALAFGGANKLDISPVKADPIEPIEYSVTFDDDNPYQVVGNNYVFYVETESGNKVGLVATKYIDNLINFHGIDFEALYFFDKDGSLTSAGAYGFSSITYFNVDYSGGDLWFNYNNNHFQDINRGQKQTTQNPPINPCIEPVEFDGPKATISSITIWYSC